MIADRDPGDEHVESAPAAPPAAERLSLTMARTACAIAARLGGPVYLVGSALTEANPADIDIRVVLADHIERLFGPRTMRGGRWWDWTEQDVRRGREQLKQSRRLSRQFGLNVDFQIQTQGAKGYVVGYRERPKLRLDTMPDTAFGAGLGDA